MRPFSRRGRRCRLPIVAPCCSNSPTPSKNTNRILAQSTPSNAGKSKPKRPGKWQELCRTMRYFFRSLGPKTCRPREKARRPPDVEAWKYRPALGAPVRSLPLELRSSQIGWGHRRRHSRQATTVRDQTAAERRPIRDLSGPTRHARSVLPMV